MEEIILKNIAYNYYPKNICNIKNLQEYSSSIEFKRLINIVNSFNDDFMLNDFKILFSELKKEELFKNIKDNSSFNSDRCLTLNIEFLENNDRLINININISLLIPYYFIYIVENQIKLNPYKWITIPKRNKLLEKEKYNNQINTISKLIEKMLNFRKFPENLLSIIIKDLSFQDNSFGNFTFFNAFFHDNNIQ